MDVPVTQATAVAGISIVDTSTNSTNHDFEEEEITVELQPQDISFRNNDVDHADATKLQEDNDVFTVEQAVDQIGFGLFQLKISVVAGLAWTADAMEMMILSILAPELLCRWQLTPWKEAWITTVVFIGMMSSSSLWGYVCDKSGRRVGLLLSSLVTFYFGFLSSFSPSFSWVLLLRGLVGFGIGGAPQAVTLYAEFLPKKSRARCIVAIEVFWAIGACLATVVALLVMPELGWQYLLGICSIPIGLFSILCLWLPESPRFDILSGRRERAIATLERIANDNKKPMPLGTLVYIPETSRGRMWDLFSQEYLRTSVLLCFIWTASTFCYYGIVLLTSELFQLEENKCLTESSLGGRNTLSCYAECHLLDTRDYIDILWTSLAEFPGLILTFLIIEPIGRKPSIATEVGLFGVFVLFILICAHRPVTVVLLFCARALISGSFQAVYVYTPEVYPTTIRGLAVGLCSGAGRLGAIITPFVAQVALQKSIYLTVGIYAGVAFTAAIAACCLPFETKGRHMPDARVTKTPVTIRNDDIIL